MIQLTIREQIKLKINPENLPKDARYIAQNKSGQWLWFDKKPKLLESVWAPTGLMCGWIEPPEWEGEWNKSLMKIG